MANICVDDIGTVIEIQILEDTLPVNLSVVDDIWLIFFSPTSEKITKKKSQNELELVDGGTTGKFSFTSSKGFWKKGRWGARPYIIAKTDVETFSGTQIDWEVV